MAEWKTAGKVRMTPKGEYDSTVPYNILDVVRNSTGDITYVAKQDVPAGTALSNTDYWEVIVSADGAVKYNTVQSLTAVQKEQARENIDAPTTGDVEALQELVKTLCPAVTVGPAAVVSMSDAVAFAPDALTVAVAPTQDLHGYDAPWPGGAAPGILYSKEVSLTDSEITLPLTLESGTYTLWAQAVSTNPDPDAIYEIKAYPSVTTGTYQEIDLYTGSSAPSAGCGVSTGAVDGIVLEGGITGHEYPPAVRVMVLSGDVAPANIPSWENICPITGRTGASIGHGASADDPDAQTYAFTFPTSAGMVYGGTLDVLTGVLTVTHAALVVDGSTVTYTYVVSSSGRGQFRVQSAVFKQAVQGQNVAVSNWLPTTLIRINSGTGFLYGYTTGTASDTNDFEDMLGITSAEQLNALCAETPLTVVYALKTPVTYQLAPAQVTMLVGANSIWADCGDTTLTYRANPYDRLLSLIRSYHPSTTVQSVSPLMMSMPNIANNYIEDEISTEDEEE